MTPTLSIDIPKQPFINSSYYSSNASIHSSYNVPDYLSNEFGLYIIMSSHSVKIGRTDIDGYRNTYDRLISSPTTPSELDARILLTQGAQFETLYVIPDVTNTDDIESLEEKYLYYYNLYGSQFGSQVSEVY